ncbi:hypothetical protein N657DRAFT_557527, partial [Parathielavia appendiculata]
PAIRRLPEFDWGGDQFNAPPSVSHGTPVISKVTGWQLGMAKRANVIVVTDRRSPPADGYNLILERHIEGWIRVHNEVKRIYAADPSQRGKIIASWSHSLTRATHFAVIRPIFARSPYADWLIMAPAFQLYLADTPDAIVWGGIGNSFATPLVAGLVAYWRSLPNIANGWGEELKKPANVKKLLRYMQRVILDEDLARGLDKSQV